MAQTDEEARKFLLDLMQRIPGELVTIARETRKLIDQAQATVDALSKQLDEIEQRGQKLCNVVTQAHAIGPLWRITQDEGEPSEPQ